MLTLFLCQKNGTKLVHNSQNGSGIMTNYFIPKKVEKLTFLLNEKRYQILKMNLVLFYKKCAKM